jgi:uncharacterized protein
MAKVKSLKDLIVLLLYAKGHTEKPCEPIKGRTRLMKMIFLFDKEIRRQFNLEGTISKTALPDFTAYDFGPFSSQVFTDLEFLVEMGFVKVDHLKGTEMPEEEESEYEYWQAGSVPESDLTAPQLLEQFSLTPIGRSFVEDGEAGKLTAEQMNVLNEFKRRCTAIQLRALLKYVYANYPKWATRSKIKEELG